MLNSGNSKRMYNKGDFIVAKESGIGCVILAIPENHFIKQLNSFYLIRVVPHDISDKGLTIRDIMEYNDILSDPNASPFSGYITTYFATEQELIENFTYSYNILIGGNDKDRV